VRYRRLSLNVLELLFKCMACNLRRPEALLVLRPVRADYRLRASPMPADLRDVVKSA